MTEELKPCPFCGSEDISMGGIPIHNECAWGNPNEMHWAVGCRRCGGAMLVRMSNYDGFDDLPTATEASRIATERWNKRARE